MKGQTMEHVIDRLHDRTGWGDGPWGDEPDRVQWTDAATGLPCLIRRSVMGAWCGYVGVPPEHPWYGHDYAACFADHDHDADDAHCWEDSIEARVSVHGGLTYASACDGDTAEGVCHVPEPGQPDHAWWFGFDCAHAFDLVPSLAEFHKLHGYGFPERDIYRDREYVTASTQALAMQLAAVKP